MARGTHEHMLAVAKKKPQLKEIIDNIETYTKEELKVIQGQPGWIKKRLIQLKEVSEVNEAIPERRQAGYLTPEQIADKMTDTSGSDATLVFPAYQYSGGEINIGGKLKLEVSTGDYILLLPDNKVKVNPTVVDVSDLDIHRLLSDSTALGNMAIPEYNSAMQAYLGNKHFGTSSESDSGPKDYSLDSIMARGVKIK